MASIRNLSAEDLGSFVSKFQGYSQLSWVRPSEIQSNSGEYIGRSAKLNIIRLESLELLETCPESFDSRITRLSNLFGRAVGLINERGRKSDRNSRQSFCYQREARVVFEMTCLIYKALLDEVERRATQTQ